jgi:hypothetical protein
MGHRRYRSPRIGRPCKRVPTTWAMVRSHPCKFGWVALIVRTRFEPSGSRTAYAVARSRNPISANGVLLRTLEALPYLAGGRRFCKVRDPEAWHSSLSQAEAKLRSLRRRGGY